MATIKQLRYLILQELKSASRSRYILISFIILPLLMWAIQGGLQIVMFESMQNTGSETTLYITNFDSGRRVNLTQPYQLPIDFQGQKQGTNVTSLALSDFLVAMIEHLSQTDNTSALYEVNIVTNYSYNELTTLSEQGDIQYWLHIPEGFAQNYTTIGYASVSLRYLQSGFLEPFAIQNGINQIMNVPPFTIVQIQKVTTVETELITLGGESEEDVLKGFSAGFAGFIAIMIAVFAPAPFVSTSFAGEREKKTMEALLALPMTRRTILMGKLISGMCLVFVFAVMNILGMALYNFMSQDALSRITNGEATNGATTFLSIDINPLNVLAISISMMLSAFIAIGIGIAIASLTKDVRTSESLYQLTLMIPSLLVGIAGMFSGVPESMGGAALLLYLIPWAHSLAIFQKMLRPGFYDVKSLLGFGLYVDLIFHLLFLLLSIVIIITIASKVFEREGIVN